MNLSPFSLDTQFFPEDAREDKIDLDLGKWSVFGIDPNEENVHAFKSYMSSPPDGQEDMAWATETNPAMYGAFLRRPEMVGKDRNKLWIRKQAVIDPASQRRHEPPLCGGYCLFYEKKQRLLMTGDIIHRARLRLSLNLQRFIRHQAEQDDPIRPWRYRLQKRKEKRASFDDEQSLDGEDNWIPSTPEWQRFASRDHFGRYLEQIGDQLRSDLTRACRFITSINKDERNDDWHDPKCERKDDYSLSLVETLWEFPSSSPIQDTWEIGAKLMNLFKEGGKVSTIEVPDMSAKEGSEEPAEAGRILNSPCFSIPIAEGVRVKLYAKTNKRIRFEIVQADLWKHRKRLLEEAGIQPKTDEQPWDEIPHLLKVLRGRAAKHMNHLMEHLRKDQKHEVQPRSLIHLLSEIAAAAQPTYFTQNRQDSIQALLIWLCYYGGYRGSTKNGPYSRPLTILESRGVIKFDPSRKFYVLCEAYKAAAAALVSTTGEPLLAFFGVENGFRWSQESKMPIRLRE